MRAFYERHPYPPPVDSLEKYRRLWQDHARRRADHHLSWPHRRFGEPQAILIAGCGTSQAAKHALRWPEARVTGIDFSETSVRHTAELKRRHGLDNLEVRHLPLERVGELGETFDQVVCTGVLHHLPDPDAGLAALRDVLAPGGVMHLMVYAPYGRTGIYMLQEFCRRLGVRATSEDLRELVAALAALPPAHPLATLLREAPDFRDEAALADALLHPQDRAYSVPQLFEFLERAGLRFGRWVKQAPYDARCGLMARLPQAARLARLAPAEQFAAVELFRGTMVRHSVVAYHGAHATRPLLTDEGWPDLVPLRQADTICVEEPAHPGAAAVLINRTHAYKDLFLPVSESEKRLFDAIDGARTLRQIARAPGELERTRAFFERLHAHDQIVFDASS